MAEILSRDELQNNWDTVQEKVKQTAKAAGRKAEDIKVVAVSKTHPADMLVNAAECGIRVFGENYAQEMKGKYEYLRNAEELEWHFIGHLQRNKVKYIAPFVDMIQSVDSLRLAEEISKQSRKNNRTTDILLQVNCSGEDSKFGCEPEELARLLEKAKDIDGIRICGLMTIGSFSTDDKVIRREFSILKELHEDCRKQYPVPYFTELSMGMSHDYETAVEMGATIVRIGTAIFGERDYSK